MNRTVTFRATRGLFLAALASTFLAACSSEAPSPGKLTLAASVPGDVTSVTAFVTSPTFSTSAALAPVPGAVGQWAGTIEALPPGSYQVSVEARGGPTGAVLFQGSGNAEILVGQTAAVQIFAQDVAPTPSYANTPPHIDAISASSLVVAPNGTVSLTVGASDRDAGALLTYLWRASAGAFSDPAAPSTTWTAPPAA